LVWLDDVKTLSRPLKNSPRGSVLKGRGFEPRPKCRKINCGFNPPRERSIGEMRFSAAL